ncbi:hypothetical protein V7S57_06645 [Caulobacter sp. CCNWLY153]|uniref:hypothetical protein n=1 Tax=unclassified Caulobacter TaxID=2648921 RepID=UPI002FEE9E77
MRLLLGMALAVALAMATPAEAMLVGAPPSLEQVLTPAGVGEYRQAKAVALVRPKAVWNPPCWLASVLSWGPWGSGPEASGDYCSKRERSRRYRLEVIETLKGAPPRTLPARFRYDYPLDPDFMRRERPDLWIHAHDLDTKRAAGRHAGFLFLHRGRINDRELDVEGVFDRPRVSDGTISRPILDPSLDYLVFLNERDEIDYWEPVRRGGGDSDLLVQRLRKLRAGARDGDVRLSVSPAEFFGRFSDAAIYEVSAPSCRRPHLVGGHRIASMDLPMDLFGSELLGPALPCRPGAPPRRYLALKALPRDWSPFGWDWYGADARILPITNGKVRPGDLVSQLRLAPADPIPVEQVLAWLGKGISDQDRWMGVREQDAPLRVDAAGRSPYLHGPSPVP